jgi:hypothetical protein
LRARTRVRPELSRGGEGMPSDERTRRRLSWGQMEFKVNDVEQPRLPYEREGQRRQPLSLFEGILKAVAGGIHIAVASRALATRDSHQRFRRRPARQRVVSN